MSKRKPPRPAANADGGTGHHRAPPSPAVAAAPSANERLINQLRKRRHDAVHRGGEPERMQRSKGKLTARERIRRLLDQDSFVELDAFVSHRSTQFDMAERTALGDGVVTGFGLIAGRQVFVFSHDASFMGGSLGEAFAEKVC
ncbi:MAG: carboxyl transferase domain-containing protein, partial [Candidatus Dormibacteria bacterium]